MLRALIIGNETNTGDPLARLLAKHCPQVSLVGVASSVAKGIGVIRALHPDLVFLDVNLHDGPGFDLIHSVNAIDFRLIFISACDKGLVQAFRLSGFEYLLKPINPEELKAAVRGVEENYQQDLVLQLKALEANV